VQNNGRVKRIAKVTVDTVYLEQGSTNSR